MRCPWNELWCPVVNYHQLARIHQKQCKNKEQRATRGDRRSSEAHVVVSLLSYFSLISQRHCRFRREFFHSEQHHIQKTNRTSTKRPQHREKHRETGTLNQLMHRYTHKSSWKYFFTSISHRSHSILWSILSLTE